MLIKLKRALQGSDWCSKSLHNITKPMNVILITVSGSEFYRCLKSTESQGHSVALLYCCVCISRRGLAVCTGCPNKRKKDKVSLFYMALFQRLV